MPLTIVEQEDEHRPITSSTSALIRAPSSQDSMAGEQVVISSLDETPSPTFRLDIGFESNLLSDRCHLDTPAFEDDGEVREHIHSPKDEKSEETFQGRFRLRSLIIGHDEPRCEIEAIGSLEEGERSPLCRPSGVSAKREASEYAKRSRFLRGEKPEATPRDPFDLGSVLDRDRRRDSFWQVAPQKPDPKELSHRYQVKVEPADVSLDLIVVGHAPTPREIEIYRIAQRSIVQAQDRGLHRYVRDQLGIKRLRRGTYSVPSMPQEQVLMLNAMLQAPLFRENSRAPDSVIDCISGYLFENECATRIAIFKPADEVRGAMNAHENPRVVPFSKAGIRPEREIENEVITAGLRDLPNVVMQVMLSSDQFNIPDKGRFVGKKGMLVEFIPAAKELSELSPIQRQQVIDSTTPRALQKLAITDLSLCNVDRNIGNIMVSEKTGELVAIDHANIAPEKFRSAAKFAWASWPAAHAPFTPQSLEEINVLDFGRDLVRIKKAYPDYPAQNLESMELSYYLLKQCAAAGLTPLQIAWFYHPSTGQFSPMLSMYQTSHPEGSLSRCTEAMKVLIDRMIKQVKEVGPKADERVRVLIEEGAVLRRDKLLFQEYDKLVEW